MRDSSPSKPLIVAVWSFVVAWAVALGAKIFDLMVLGTAWGAAPPESFRHLPYGNAFPIDPGTFFQPLSAILLLAGLASLVLGWKTPSRKLLLVSCASLVVIWVFTPTVFWPMITELWEIHRGRLQTTEAGAIGLVRRWFLWDAGRIVFILVGFVASVRALCVLESSART